MNWEVPGFDIAFAPNLLGYLREAIVCQRHAPLQYRGGHGAQAYTVVAKATVQIMFRKHFEHSFNCSACCTLYWQSSVWVLPHLVVWKQPLLWLLRLQITHTPPSSFEGLDWITTWGRALPPLYILAGNSDNQKVPYLQSPPNQHVQALCLSASVRNVPHPR